MTWQPIETAPRDVRVLTLRAGRQYAVSVARLSTMYGGWLDDFDAWAMPVPTHWQPLPSADPLAPSDAEVKRMLMDVLLGIGMIFHCTIEEMQEDPSIIITRIEQSLGPNGPRRRSDA